MTTQHNQQIQMLPTRTRRQFLQAATAAGAGLALAGTMPLAALAEAPETAASCSESVQDILNLAFGIERAATTFYYTGLTSKAVMSSPKLAGMSGDPRAVSSDGTPQNVANLQAALDQERKHALALASAGAVSSQTQFYFPGAAFESLGYTSWPGTFLWTLDHLETICIACYLAAVMRFGRMGRPDLAALAVRSLAVESEHRALYRVIAGDDPADNITLPVAEFRCVSDVLPILSPYLTGQGFPAGITDIRTVTLPSTAQTSDVVGRYTSS